MQDDGASDRDGSKAKGQAKVRPAEAEKQPSKRGSFKASELPPVPEWARRAPSAQADDLFADVDDGRSSRNQNGERAT